MTVRSLLTGKLIRDPQAKTAASGKGYTSCTLKADQDGDTALFVRVLAFGDASDRLAGLRAGDAVSAAGTLKLGIYKPDGGDPRLDATLLADEVLSVRRKPREHRQQHDDRGHGDRDGPPAGDPRWLDA